MLFEHQYLQGYVNLYGIQVLNETSMWWFNKTKHITENAIVSAPDPNVTIAKKCTVFPVEFVGLDLFPFSFPLCLVVCLYTDMLVIDQSRHNEMYELFLRSLRAY